MAFRRILDTVLENRPQSRVRSQAVSFLGEGRRDNLLRTQIPSAARPSETGPWGSTAAPGKAIVPQAAFRPGSPAQSRLKVRTTRIQRDYEVPIFEQKGNAIHGLRRNSTYPLPPFFHRRTVQP